ncbi:hypothetical protein ACEPAG_1328 [Sanghuangporus baumii]
MKVNQNLAIVGEKVLLVPYRKEHVKKYHEWMLDEELQLLTDSFPLTLEEEYEMQQQWEEDADKLTFIILSRGEPKAEESNDLAKVVSESIYDTSRMIGDVNLFFKGSPSDDDYKVEAEIMIAVILEKRYRRTGFATEALQLFLSFATSFHYQPPPPASDSGNAVAQPHSLPISADKLFALIGMKNSASQSLFKKLGFVVTAHYKVIDEVEMRLVGDDLSGRVNEWAKGTIVALEDDVA